MSQEVLVALAVLEFGLTALAIYRRSSDGGLLFFFVMVLLMQEHELAVFPILVAGAVGYAASVFWRSSQLPTRFHDRVRLWLFRRGFERSFQMWPRSPIVIATGTSIALMMPDPFTVSAAVLLAMFTVATSREWRRARFGPPMIALTISASALVFSLAFLLALAVGLISWANPMSARDVLSQLLGVQIALGLLPLTALSFAAPFVAGAAGAGAATVLPWPRVAGAIGLVLLSMAFDVYLLGGVATGGDLEWAEISALVAIGTSLLVSVATAQYLQPRTVASALVQRVDSAWLDEVRRKYQEPHQPWLGPDPVRDLERLLYIAATRESDIRLFRGTLRLLLDRIRLLVERSPATTDDRSEIGLDEYFAGALSALIEDAARQGKGWALETLVHFRREMTDYAVGQPPQGGGAPPHFIERTFFDAPPSGLQLYGRLVEAAIDFGLTDVGQLAATQVGVYAREHLAGLPDPTGVHDIDPAAQVAYHADAPAQRAAEGLSEVLDKLSRWAERASRMKQRETAESVAHAISLLSASSSKLADSRWAKWLAGRATIAAYGVALEGLKSSQVWYDVPSSFEDFSGSNPSHVAAVDGMTFYTALTIASCAPFASYFLIVDATMLGLHWMPDFLPEAATIGAALEYIKRRQAVLGNDEHSLVVRESERRLDQLRTAAGARGPEYDDWKSQFTAQLEHDVGPLVPPAPTKRGLSTAPRRRRT